MTTAIYASRTYHQVNFTDTGGQAEPAVVDIGSGRYIVVWTEEAGGPIGTSPFADLVGQIFNADGSRFGSEFQVNASFVADNEFGAVLASRPGGGFVTVYMDNDGINASIRAQTRDVNGALVAGTPVTIQLDLNDDRLSNPAVAMRPDGSYLVAYNRLVDADGTLDIVARIVSAAGTVGNEFSIFNSTDRTQGPDIDILSNGNYVIVFHDADNPMLDDYDPQFQIHNASGGLVSGATIDFGANGQFDVHVAALTGGGFVTVWTEFGGDGDANETGIRARVYDNAGVAVGAAFTVNTFVNGNQNNPDVVALDDSGFLVTWHDETFDSVTARRFDASGTPTPGSPMGIGQEGTNPTAVRLSDGRVMIVIDQTIDDDDVGGIIFAIGMKTNDFNGDVRSDILWRNNDGTVATWDMNGAEILGTHSFAGAPNDWHLQGTGDFDGDGRNDLLWRQDTGTIGFWHMDGATVLSMPTLATPAPSDWHVAGTGNFNGDRTTDILWRHDSGIVGTWHMDDGGNVMSDQTFANAPLDWHIEGTGDFNGDGMDDLLWRQDGGDIGVWLMNGAAVLSTHVFGNAPNTWHIEGTGDFNGDGNDDILWRHDDGTVGTWHMAGGAVISTQAFANAPLNWHIEGTGDYNADGMDDILWRSDDGTVGVWHMAGALVLSTPTYAAQPADWEIIGNEFDLI